MKKKEVKKKIFIYTHTHLLCNITYFYQQPSEKKEKNLLLFIWVHHINTYKYAYEMEIEKKSIIFLCIFYCAATKNVEKNQRRKKTIFFLLHHTIYCRSYYTFKYAICCYLAKIFWTHMSVNKHFIFLNLKDTTIFMKTMSNEDDCVCRYMNFIT